MLEDWMVGRKAGMKGCLRSAEREKSAVAASNGETFAKLLPSSISSLYMRLPMFKLAPAGQDFSICLRCRDRFNLSKSVRTSRRLPLQTTSHPSYHLRSFTSHGRLRQENTQKAYTEETSPLRTAHRYEEKNTRSARHRPPPPKSPLSVESMGEPAEVLVLRNTPQAAKNIGVIFTEESGKSFPTSLEGSAEALLDGIDKERGIVDLDQVCFNIDCIRDAFMENRRGRLAPLSVEEYNEILSKLLGGFEKKHLAEYWRRSGSKANTDALNLRFPYSSALFARSAWTPGTTSLEYAKAPPLMDAGNIQKGATRGRLSLRDRGKQWHAENILQRCWGLNREQVDTVGELSLRLQQKHLELLLNHGGRSMFQSLFLAH